MALKITGPDDWTRLSRLGGPVVDPMVLRCGELFLHGARGVKNPDAAWALLTKNVHALALFFDRLILDDQIPVFDYADTFDAEQNFSQRTFGKVNQEDEILVEVNVAWEAYDTVKRAALAEVEKLYSSDAGVDARLAKSILDELSTSGYAWFPQLGDLAFRSADEQRLASFILGGLIFGAYAQLAGTEHLLQPKRSELFLAVSLRQPGLHSVDRRLFERLGQLAGQATAEVPYTPTFFPLLLHLSEGPADVLSNALEIRKSAEAGDYRQWWRDTLLEFKESGRIPVAREREAQRIAEAVERKQKGLPIPKVAVKTTVADVAAGGAPGVAVDFTDPAKALWGWCVGMLPGKRHRKLLTRAVIADREYVELDRRVKTVWSGEGVRV